MGPPQVHSREGRQCGGRKKRARPWEKMGALAVSLQENREVLGEREAAEGAGGGRKGNRCSVAMEELEGRQQTGRGWGGADLVGG